ncbi:sulfotransferase domain-containing protein [Marinobacter sp. M216]|uniref:Sulfotransferase domain-containing protein n=1 Tax=Marinobacter albus TaxID=3030833 RepID=A0ABT7HA74_9GAMM|nr:MULTISPECIES: sulfotransferase domain-containing protein [unclassified Marinobacter]MBW7470467.1 sulfotransferase domain-containing protein [Marinobacter sp. F4218]MDK9557265.1 sulfotransferase domain-containing protein [Marinobacter sp. M216]
MLVNFLVAGTQKGGTSALDAYLREHPQICMANRKEVHFFDNEAAFANGAANYKTYHAAFSPTKDHTTIGESTPIYMYWEPAPRRIWEYNPDMKIILTLRNPIDRAYSHWNMETARGKECVSFKSAIIHENERSREVLPNQHRVYSYTDRGFYSYQLKRLWHYFSKENTLILRHEELKTSPNHTLRKVTDFLGLAPLPTVHPKEVHRIDYQSVMSQEERELLFSIFQNEIAEIERLLDWDCTNWRAI